MAVMEVVDITRIRGDLFQLAESLNLAILEQRAGLGQEDIQAARDSISRYLERLSKIVEGGIYGQVESIMTDLNMNFE
ncbi:MAG: hypothetical protein ACE5DX_05135 [Candidatus Dojkabacteria bacterium]